MPRKPSLKTVKKKAWEVFSKYIRLKYADDNGNCTCVTCGTVKPWTEMQAGHSIGGRMNSILFHEEIVHPQCVSCNIFQNGNYTQYTLYMIDRYGRDRFEELIKLKFIHVKFSIAALNTLIDTYNHKISELSLGRFFDET